MPPPPPLLLHYDLPARKVGLGIMQISPQQRYSTHTLCRCRRCCCCAAACPLEEAGGVSSRADPILLKGTGAVRHANFDAAAATAVQAV